MRSVSFIIPCYNSKDTIRGVVSEIEISAKDLCLDSYEIVLVNDFSSDDVMEVIRSICADKAYVIGLDLAHNAGQHAAIMAGIREATCGVLVFLDDDGQTPASEAGKLLDALDESCDIVFAKYAQKRHPLWRNFGSKVNDIMAEALIGKPKHLSISSYCACKRFVVEEIKRYDGSFPYISGLLLRSSGRVKNVLINHRVRMVGRSGYSMKKLIALWLNGFTAFSVKPLRFATGVGIIVAMIGFLYGIYTIIHRLLNPEIPLGYSSTMAVLLFIGGMIMVMLGIIGEYVGRIYININKAPQYVIRKKYNSKEGTPVRRV